MKDPGNPTDQLAKAGWPDVNAWHWDQVRRLASIEMAVIALPEHTAWNYDVVLNEMRVRRIEDGWQIILKGKRRSQYVAAFIWGQTYGEALEIMNDMASRAALEWRVDKFPPK